MNWGRLKFQLFGNWPVIGKQIQLDYYNSVIERITNIEKRYNSPRVGYDTHIHSLYDCLYGSMIELDEDIQWFLTLGITTYTKTSAMASECLQRIIKGEIFKYEEYFKELNVSSRETEMLDWYSNYEDTAAFMGDYLYMMQVYCLENPLDDNDETGAGAEVYKDSNRWEINRSTLDFINSSHFRLMLDDFITVIKLSIDSQIRRLNG